MSVSETANATLSRKGGHPLNGWQRVVVIVAIATVEVGVTLRTGSVEQGIAAVAPFVWLLR